MKLLVLACAVTIVSAVYTDVDDTINIKAVDSNDEEIMNTFECFLDRKPCDNTMLSYKKHFYEAFHNSCANCTPLQKHIGEEFFKTAYMKFPKLVTELQQKYDSKGEDFKLFLAELAKYDY